MSICIDIKFRFDNRWLSTLAPVKLAMVKYKLIAFADPVAGRVQEYDTWHNETHLADVNDVADVVRAQRLKPRSTTAGDLPNHHLPVYEFGTDSPEAAVEEIYRRAGASVIVLSETLDETTRNIGLLEPCFAEMTD